MARPSTFIDRYLDDLCARTHSPSVLNALHACRSGHPLNSETQWRDAYVLVQQHTQDFLGADLAWLRERALEEW
jgi:hypothetical protein